MLDLAHRVRSFTVDAVGRSPYTRWLEAKLRREMRRSQVLTEALHREEERTARLRDSLEQGAVGVNGTLRARLPFLYTGPAGRLALSNGFELAVPARVVHKLDLADGDLLEVNLTPPGRVELEVVDSVPRREVLGHVRPFSAETWEVVGTHGRRIGFIGEAEARAHDLREGDPVTVLRPGPFSGRGGDKFFLPRVKVLRVHREVRASGGPPRETRTRPGRKKRRRSLKRAGKPSGRLMPVGRPLAGKSVLVVGGESFHSAYRRIIESLGGTFDGLGADDRRLAPARALAADIVVVVTPYVSHKASDAVHDALSKAGREGCLAWANTTGQRGLLEALRPFHAGTRGRHVRKR